MKKVFISCILSTLFMSFDIEDTEQMISILERPEIAVVNSEYVNNRAPLLPMHFIKLPVGSYEITEIKIPEGYLQLDKPVTFEIKNIKDYDTDKDGDFIKEIVSYTRNKEDKNLRFKYQMTTNGVYLKKYIEYFL